MRQICEIFDDFFVFHCATLLCFIIVIYVIIVKCEVMTSLNTLCYVPLLLCINSNPYTCEDSGRFVRFCLPTGTSRNLFFHYKFQKWLFTITIQVIQYWCNVGTIKNPTIFNIIRLVPRLMG